MRRSKNPAALRLLAGLSLVGLAVALLAACGTSAGSTGDTPGQPGAVDPAALLETRCAACHSASKATSDPHTQAEWEQIVSTMVGKGASLSDAEKGALVDYLATNYGK